MADALTKSEILERLFKIAEQHGSDSEPDMEVGDLQFILRTTWKKLTPAQAHEVLNEVAPHLPSED